MVYFLILLAALFATPALAQNCIGPLASDGSNPCPSAATVRTNLGISGTGAPGGSSGQIQYNSSGSFAGMTAMSGDCSIVTSTGVITCTKLNSVSPGSFFSGTDAANLTGNIATARLPTTATDREVPFSFSGSMTIAASIPVTRAIGRNFRVPTNPTWYSYCTTLPTASMNFALSYRHSGSNTSVGNVVVGTAGTVTSSPSWATVDLVAGDAIWLVSPSSADATANGCGLVMVGSYY